MKTPPNIPLSLWAADLLGIPHHEAPVMALSFRQPWCEFIFAGKDVENRRWISKKKGWIFMCASAECDMIYDFADSMMFAESRMPHALWDGIKYENLKLGGIVGAIRIAPCLISGSKWAMPAQMQIPILEARRLPFIPCRGAQRWFVPQCSPPVKCPACEDSAFVVNPFDPGDARPCPECKRPMP